MEQGKDPSRLAPHSITWYTIEVMDQRIDDLRKDVDRINRELLGLLSERGRIVSEIGRVQT